MKYLIAFLIFLALPVLATQWPNYPTTNTMGSSDTLMIGNGGTNATITAGNFNSTQTQPLINTASNSVLGNAQTAINTSSNSVFGSALTQINTTSNSLNGTINSASNSVYANANTAINVSSNSITTNLPPRANYPALTNTTTGVIGNVLLTTSHLDTNGSPAAIWTNLQPFNMEFHVATNAFTNIVVGYIGPLTNIDGLKFYIPIGTNVP